MLLLDSIEAIIGSKAGEEKSYGIYSVYYQQNPE